MSAVHLLWITVALVMGVAVPRAALAQEVPKTSIGTAIATLMVRDHVVVLAATTAGIRYSLATHDGRSLGADLSGGELEARFPTIFEFIRSSIARSPESREFIWAGR